jgi:hypothetical protein
VARGSLGIYSAARNGAIDRRGHCEAASARVQRLGEIAYSFRSEFSSSIQRLTLTIVSPMVLSDILSPAYISLDSSIFNCRWSVDRICIQSSIKSVIAVTIDFSVPSEN